MKLQSLLATCLALALVSCSGDPEAAGALRIDPLDLSGVPDSEVEFAIVQHVGRHLEGRNDREVELIQSLPKGFQVVHTTWIVEAEVNNGGFNQYFWNSPPELAPIALASFRELGATGHASLVAKAIEIYHREATAHESARREGTIEAFSESYKHTDLNSLDEEFYNLPSASEARVKYIRQHPKDFSYASGTAKALQLPAPRWACQGIPQLEFSSGGSAKVGGRLAAESRAS